MALSIDDRMIIKKELPYGAQIEIAKKLGITAVSVCNYLNGKTKNSIVEKEILAKYKIIKKEKKELQKLIYG